MSAPLEPPVQIAFEPIPDAKADGSGLPYVTHSGVWELAPGLAIKLYMLSDGRPIIAAESMDAFLRWLGGTEGPSHG